MSDEFIGICPECTGLCKRAGATYVCVDCGWSGWPKHQMSEKNFNLMNEKNEQYVKEPVEKLDKNEVLKDAMNTDAWKEGEEEAIAKIEETKTKEVTGESNNLDCDECSFHGKSEAGLKSHKTSRHAKAESHLLLKDYIKILRILQNVSDEEMDGIKLETIVERHPLKSRHAIRRALMELENYGWISNESGASPKNIYVLGLTGAWLLDMVDGIDCAGKLDTTESRLSNLHSIYTHINNLLSNELKVVNLKRFKSKE